MSPRDYGRKVREALEANPGGLSYAALEEATGLTKPQVKSGLRDLRRDKAFVLSYDDGVIRLPRGPEDAMRTVVYRVETLVRDLEIQLYTVDRFVEEQGISEELEGLYRQAIAATQRLDHAFRSLDLLEEEDAK